MSRSGYSDDCDNYGLWIGAVASSIWGRRGQAFLIELRDALDAMPVKELVAGTFKDDTGCLCTLGVIAESRGVDFGQFPADPDDINARSVAKTMGVAHALAAEVMFQNDEGNWRGRETPAERWQRMRNWCGEHIATGEEATHG